MTMTKAADAILAVITVTTLYLALYCKAIPTPTIFHDEILPVLPWWALITYGCYALFSLGYGVYTLHDKKDKYEELKDQIVEAKAFLKKNGIDVGED